MPPKMVCVDGDELSEMRLQFSAHECTHVNELPCKPSLEHVAIPSELAEALVKWFEVDMYGAMKNTRRAARLILPWMREVMNTPMDGGSGEPLLNVSHPRSDTRETDSIEQRLAKIEERLNKLESPPIDVEAFKKSNPDIFYARDAREIKMAQDRANRVKS